MWPGSSRCCCCCRFSGCCSTAASSACAAACCAGTHRRSSMPKRRRKKLSRSQRENTMRKTTILPSTIALAASAGFAQAQTNVRVAWCAKTVSSAAAPYAIAAKMGWYAKAGIKVELVPMPGSTDCVKAVATKDVQYGVPSIEPVAIIRPQGVKIKNFYTAYQANIYGIAVPHDSPIKTFADLKGKQIGVTAMGSADALLARSAHPRTRYPPAKCQPV